MIRSMTGFGEAHADVAYGRIRAQVKTVNHRFFNTSIRLPNGLDRLEAMVTERLRGVVHRGHVHFSLAVDRGAEGSDAPLPELDLERARHMKGLLEELATELDLSQPLNVDHFMRFGDLFRAPNAERRLRETITEELLAELTDRALTELIDMRTREGARMAADMMARLEEIARLAALVGERAPVRLSGERDRLREQIAELTEAADVDEDRLAREVAYLAEKWDINEEIVRLDSHVKLFSETLAEGGDQGVGKRLGFVLQEMNREANTIASKANDSEIARLSVSMKEEVERLREQVENVE